MKTMALLISDRCENVDLRLADCA